MRQMTDEERKMSSNLPFGDEGGSLLHVSPGHEGEQDADVGNWRDVENGSLNARE